MAIPIPLKVWRILIIAGLLVVAYFAIIKIYAMGLNWLDKQKQEAVTAALENQANTISAATANAQLDNISLQLDAQRQSQQQMMKLFQASRNDMRRLEQLQREQNLAQVMQTDPELGVRLVNQNTASVWAEFQTLNKELTHEE